MPTRQAVWPADLIERRRYAVELASRLRLLTALPPGGGGETERRALQAEQLGLPCPHWDVRLVDPASGDWECEDCAATISPTWVQLAEQETSLRRAAQLRTVGRLRGPAT